MFRSTLIGALAVLVLGLTSLGIGSKTASAEVLSEGRTPWTYVIDNPCEPGINPITFTGTVHWLWYTVADGVVMMRYNSHYTATAADGTEYVLNANRTMEHWEWPSLRGSDSIVIRLLSKGGGDNARIEINVESSATWPAPPALTVKTITCRG